MSLQLGDYIVPALDLKASSFSVSKSCYNLDNGAAISNMKQAAKTGRGPVHLQRQRYYSTHMFPGGWSAVADAWHFHNFGIQQTPMWVVSSRNGTALPSAMGSAPILNCGLSGSENGVLHQLHTSPFRVMLLSSRTPGASPERWQYDPRLGHGRVLMGDDGTLPLSSGHG
jgi:hypothetical protein